MVENIYFALTEAFNREAPSVVLASGQAVELTHSYCRNDYYDFITEMKRG